MVKLTSLYSGSHGNCTLIQSAESNILVDAGFTYNTLKRYLNEVGLTPSDITAILITHEHGDHIGALSGWAQHNDTPVFAHRLCAPSVESKCGIKGVQRFDDGFRVGDVSVDFVKCSHDASYCCGYRFYDGYNYVASVTDTGTVTEQLEEFLLPCSIVQIESNHDEDMLVRGNYPYQLKRRILSDNGHLSNRQASVLIDKLLNGNVRDIVLAHISENNNTHELAFAEAMKVFRNRHIEEGRQVRLHLAYQYNRSKTIE